MTSSLDPIAIALQAAGALLAAIIALVGRAVLARRDLRGVRAQVEYLLTQLTIEMAMARDYPEYPTIGFSGYLERLRQRVFSPDGAKALNNKQRRRVLEALSVAEQSHAFIERMRANEDPPFVEGREYLEGAARRAFNSLYDAREAFREHLLPLVRPADLVGRHMWRPGTPIERD